MIGLKSLFLNFNRVHRLWVSFGLNRGYCNNGIMEEWNDGIMDKQIGVGYRLQNARCELHVRSCRFRNVSYPMCSAPCAMRYSSNETILQPKATCLDDLPTPAKRGLRVGGSPFGEDWSEPLTSNKGDYHARIFFQPYRREIQIT